MILENLLAWSAQVAMLVAVGAAGALLLSHPRSRLIFWQGLLAVALLLPALEPWRQPAPEPATSEAVTASSAPIKIVHAPISRFAWRREYILMIIAAGIALRFSWIGVGLFRLRRHRLDAHLQSARAMVCVEHRRRAGDVWLSEPVYPFAHTRR
jgi:hypothetical protein